MPDQPSQRSFLAVCLTSVLLLASQLAAQQPTPPAGDDDLRRRLEALEERLRQYEPIRAEPNPLIQDEPAAGSQSDFAPEKVPFAWGDFRWMPGSYAPTETPLKFGAFTGEVRVDTTYHYSFAKPAGNTISGSSEVYRHSEFQITQLGLGGDIWYRGMHARFMTQIGMYSQTTPRNDPTPSRRQWNLDDAYCYVSEAYGGFSSASANNGSGFEGLGDNTVPWNLATGLVMMFASYIPIILPLAIAGSLAKKRPTAQSAGTLAIHTTTFGDHADRDPPVPP